MKICSSHVRTQVVFIPLPCSHHQTNTDKRWSLKQFTPYYLELMWMSAIYFETSATMGAFPQKSQDEHAFRGNMPGTKTFRFGNSEIDPDHQWARFTLVLYGSNYSNARKLPIFYSPNFTFCITKIY